MIALSKQKAPVSANCARCGAPLGVPIGAYAYGKCTSCRATYQMVGGAGVGLTNVLNMAPVFVGVTATAIWPFGSIQTNFWIVMSLVVVAAVAGQVALGMLNKKRHAKWSFE